jgi:hypothetical protein
VVWGVITNVSNACSYFLWLFTSRLQLPNPDKPEPRRQRIFGQKKILGCTGKLDDPPIHVPKNVPALAGLNEITFVGSSPYGIVIFTQKNSICIKFLSKNVKTWLIRD